MIIIFIIFFKIEKHLYFLYPKKKMRRDKKCQAPSLEQMLENVFVLKIAQNRLHQTIDTYTIGTT